jgi:hypothetical protein
MKKISTASFIVGVVLVVASIALIILGAVSVNSPSVYSRTINGYTYTKMSYSISVTGIINGFMMIIIGGIAFLGGMLSFILAAVTRGPKFKPCKPANANSQPSNYQPSNASSQATDCTDQQGPNPNC